MSFRVFQFKLTPDSCYLWPRVVKQITVDFLHLNSNKNHFWTHLPDKSKWRPWEDTLRVGVPGPPPLGLVQSLIICQEGSFVLLHNLCTFKSDENNIPRWCKIFSSEPTKLTQDSCHLQLRVAKQITITKTKNIAETMVSD